MSFDGELELLSAGRGLVHVKTHPLTGQQSEGGRSDAARFFVQ